MEDKRIVISGRVTHDADDKGVIRHAAVQLCKERDVNVYDTCHTVWTDHEGHYKLHADVEDGGYRVQCAAFNQTDTFDFNVPGAMNKEVDLNLNLGLRVSTHGFNEEGNQLVPVIHGIVGKRLLMRVESSVGHNIESIRWIPPKGAGLTEMGTNEAELMFGRSGTAHVEALVVDRGENGRGGHPEAVVRADLNVSE